MKILPLLLLTLISLSSFGQYQFRSFNTAGIIAGENTPALEIQTVNGAKYQRFFLGIGVGKDDYFYKSMPLFADARIFITQDQDAFIYGDLGYNFALKNTPKENYYDKNIFRGGIYTAFGIGFETKLIRQSRLVFALGHTLKKIHLLQSSTITCTGCRPSSYDNKLTFNRIVLKAGVAF